MRSIAAALKIRNEILRTTLVTPVLHLVHYQQSRTINMVLILLFGVVGNWTLIGALIGTALARSASRRARARGSAPNAGEA